MRRPGQLLTAHPHSARPSSQQRRPRGSKKAAALRFARLAPVLPAVLEPARFSATARPETGPACLEVPAPPLSSGHLSLRAGGHGHLRVLTPTLPLGRTPGVPRHCSCALARRSWESRWLGEEGPAGQLCGLQLAGRARVWIPATSCWAASPYPPPSRGHRKQGSTRHRRGSGLGPCTAECAAAPRPRTPGGEDANAAPETQPRDAES